MLAQVPDVYRTRQLSKAQAGHRSKPGHDVTTHSLRKMSKKILLGTVHDIENSHKFIPSESSLNSNCFRLSQLCQSFESLMSLNNNLHDNIEYKNTFSVSAAIQVIEYLLNLGQRDREIAIHVGHIMQREGFIEEVTFMNEFGRNNSDLFRFVRDMLISNPRRKCISDGLSPYDSVMDADSSVTFGSSNEFSTSPKSSLGDMRFQHADIYELRSRSSSSSSLDEISEKKQSHCEERNFKYPNGIIPYFLRCSSPTCTRNEKCYALSCPFKQQVKISPIFNKLETAHFSSNNHQYSCDSSDEFGGQGVERTRHQIIDELIATETEYFNDLLVLSRLYRDEILHSGIISSDLRHEFCSVVFGNIDEIVETDRAFTSSLKSLEFQKRNKHRVIGPILTRYVDTKSPSIQSYIFYGKNQVVAKHRLDHELCRNQNFMEFCDNRRRLPECRKLPIQSFLTRPISRIGRLPIILETYLQFTPVEHPDFEDIKYCIEKIKQLLANINFEAGKTDNALRIRVLHDQLTFSKQLSRIRLEDLRLTDPDRRLIRAGKLKKRRFGELIEMHLFLFDNYLLIAQAVTSKRGAIRYQIQRNPIPLYMLLLEYSQSKAPGLTYRASIRSSRAVSIISSTSIKTTSSSQGPPPSSIMTQPQSEMSRPSYKSFPVQFTHLGREGRPFSFYASNQADQREWLKTIGEAIDDMDSKMRIFQSHLLLGSRCFNSSETPSYLRDCTVFSFAEYNEMLYLGTDKGLFAGPLADLSHMRLILHMPNCIQVEFHENWNCMLLVAKKNLYAFPLELYREPSPIYACQLGTKISSRVSFFETGYNNAELYLAVVKSTHLETSVKILQYEEQVIGGGFDEKWRWFSRKLLGAQNAQSPAYAYNAGWFGVYRRISIPCETKYLKFLRTKICLGTVNGFELIDLQTLQSRSLIDPLDSTLSLASKLTDVNGGSGNHKPLGIVRLEDTDEFLCCFDSFGVYIDKFGRNSRLGHPKSIVYWLGGGGGIEEVDVSSNSVPSNPASNLEPNIPLPTDTVRQMYFIEPNLLVLVNLKFLEIRNAYTGALVQILRADYNFHLVRGKWPGQEETGFLVCDSTSSKPAINVVSDPIFSVAKINQTSKNQLFQFAKRLSSFIAGTAESSTKTAANFRRKSLPQDRVASAASECFSEGYDECEIESRFHQIGAGNPNSLSKLLCIDKV